MGISPSDKPNKISEQNSNKAVRDKVSDSSKIAEDSASSSYVDSSLLVTPNIDFHSAFAPIINLLRFVLESENVCILQSRECQTQFHESAQSEFRAFIGSTKPQDLSRHSHAINIVSEKLSVHALQADKLPPIFRDAKLYLLTDKTKQPGQDLGQELVLATLVTKRFEWTEGRIAALSDLIDLASTSMQQQAAAKALQKSEVLFKEMANLSHDFLYVKDRQDRVVYANQAIMALFNQQSLPASVSDKVLDVFEAKRRNQDASTSIEQIEADNGEQILVQSHRQAFSQPTNRDYTLMVSRDVTEREVIINDLRRSNKDLDHFAYIASHDLKAPLNVIKRLVSWVIEDCGSAMPQDCLENLELVMNRANRMEQLLQDLLSYSRIGRDYLEAKELNVKAKVIELLSLIDLPMGFSMKCDNAQVLVPEVPFGVVLLNLIANAIKHHDSGNAKIQIKVRRTQKANIITVIDNGPGIAKENQERIFDLFETLKPRDEVEGSGMGLSVVKRLVEHYGGNIKVEENRPRGTKFVVHWPFENIARKVLTQLHQQ
jgi:signal transduction histidine kinase